MRTVYHTIYLDSSFFVYFTVLASNDKSIAAMLLELCVIELEDVALNNNILLTSPQPVIQESAHPYNKQMTTTGVVRIPGEHIMTINSQTQVIW